MTGRGFPSGRSDSHVRRHPPARQSQPPLRTIQLAAAFLMGACLAGIFAVSVAPSFAARTLEIHGATFTSESIIRSIVGMNGTPNAFRIETDRAEALLVRLPAVESATVQVRLPSTVVVTIVERAPKLVWVIGANRYVVDQDGLLFGLVDSAGNPIASSAGPLATPTEPSTETASASGGTSPDQSAGVSPSPTPSPTPTPTPTPSPIKTPTPKPGTKSSAAPSGTPAATYDPSLLPSLEPAPTAEPLATSGPIALGLPAVFDRRASDAGLGLGGIIDPVNLDAGYRLAGLTPTDVGSSAASLAVVLDDDHGFTVSSGRAGWVAEFGFYAPTVRKVTVIPEQVRDLRSLLAKYGEAHVAWVRLVADVSDNHINTFIPR
jgi:hypothetical protein